MSLQVRYCDLTNVPYYYLHQQYGANRDQDDYNNRLFIKRKEIFKKK